MCVLVLCKISGLWCIAHIYSGTKWCCFHRHTHTKKRYQENTLPPNVSGGVIGDAPKTENSVHGLYATFKGCNRTEPEARLQSLKCVCWHSLFWVAPVAQTRPGGITGQFSHLLSLYILACTWRHRSPVWSTALSFPSAARDEEVLFLK